MLAFGSLIVVSFSHIRNGLLVCTLANMPRMHFIHISHNLPPSGYRLAMVPDAVHIVYRVSYCEAFLDYSEGLRTRLPRLA